MRRSYILILGVIIALFVAGCTTQTETKDINVNTEQSPTNNQNEINTETKTTIALSELSTHNNKDDCWVAYEGKVYDVTSFLGLHPGGPDAIIKYCGTASEFQTGFTKKHGTEKVSILLQQIYKGELAED